MAVELKVPSLGESITEVMIGTWYKKEGDIVGRDEAIVEIETDKTTVDLPAPVPGVISKILKQKGEIAAVRRSRGLCRRAGLDRPRPKRRARSPPPRVLPPRSHPPR
ncbi:MAG: dihydrolipoamide succinyltransferase, partial [Acidobacteria bacterium]|nr:dihydrolipoamide succinyltransferase [Acidobacteriota bacterium]